jgi:hypothetical protein
LLQIAHPMLNCSLTMSVQFLGLSRCLQNKSVPFTL